MDRVRLFGNGPDGTLTYPGQGVQTVRVAVSASPCPHLVQPVQRHLNSLYGPALTLGATSQGLVHGFHQTPLHNLFIHHCQTVPERRLR